MNTVNYEEIPGIDGYSVPVKAWVKGVMFEETARKQVANAATLPFMHSHIAIMPDVHAGIGATVGFVAASKGAIVPAMVGVDLGCGMQAVRTSLKASDLPTSLAKMRELIENNIPVGRTNNGGAGDKGAWDNNIPQSVLTAWQKMVKGYEDILAKHPGITRSNKQDKRGPTQLGSLGGGNHFIEVCLDLEQNVWIMLHSGSRGIGNAIGSYFISKAKEEMKSNHIHLIDQDLAYLTENKGAYNDYIEAVEWAQNYAKVNRELMMERVLTSVAKTPGVPPFKSRMEAVSCHHNYLSKEHHFGEDVVVTRKGAVHAGKGVMGIIPGSMGARSFIVRGLGNPDSFNYCSHGAGRVMSRTQANKTFTVADHIEATKGVECLKDESVIDETPACYKDIDAVISAQSDLIEVVYELKQVLCVKG